MKLQVLQENLAKAVSFASRFTSSKAQLPVLGNILFSAKKTNLQVSSTNLEISTAISIGAQVKEEGELTIPGRVIAEIVTNLPSGPVNLESEKEQLTVTTSNFSSRVLGMNASDFPKIPQDIDKAAKFSLPKEEFLSGLSKVLFAASIDETRPTLTGILFIFEKETLSLIATDGFRLSQNKIKAGKVGFKGRVILPKTGLSEISRLGGDVEEISFSFKDKESQAVFGVGNIVLATRIIEGDFPDYEKIIPKNPLYTISLDKEDLIRSVKLASVFARESANVVKLRLNDGSINISAESSQSGNQMTKVDAKVEGKPPDDFEIAFNYRFLEDLLLAISGEEVKMEFSDKNAPGVFTDPKDFDFLHLIMPVRIQE